MASPSLCCPNCTPQAVQPHQKAWFPKCHPALSEYHHCWNKRKQWLSFVFFGRLFTTDSSIFRFISLVTSREQHIWHWNLTLILGFLQIWQSFLLWVSAFTIHATSLISHLKWAEKLTPILKLSTMLASALLGLLHSQTIISKFFSTHSKCTNASSGCIVQVSLCSGAIFLESSSFFSWKKSSDPVLSNE